MLEHKYAVKLFNHSTEDFNLPTKWASGFPLSIQKLSWVFERLRWMLYKYSAESLSQMTSQEFLKI